MLHNILDDFRFVLRSLRRSPLFTMGVGATIALCVAANGGAFSSIYSLILKPLPFEGSDRLVQVMNVGAPGFKYQPGDDLVSSHRPSRSTWSQYRDFADHATLFEGFAFRTSQVRITAAGSMPVNSTIHGVSAGFFELMKVKPVMGRFFFTQEVDPGPGQVIVLTESTWEKEYGADPSVLGREVRVGDGVPYTVVGVAPRSMEVFDFRAKYFVPFPVPRRARDIRVNGALDLWARLKEGVSPEAGLAELQAIENRWYDEVAAPAERSHHDTFSDHLEFGSRHPLQSSLMLLQGAALLVLLVGALNVLTLLLARANQRSEELSVRAALGAPTSRLRRLMVIESALLCALGLGIGFSLTAAALKVVNSHLSILDPGSPPIEIDGLVVAVICTLAVCGVCSMGLIPLETLNRPGNLAPGGGRAGSARLGSRRLAGQLVIVEVAFAFTLLIGAGLLLQSFFNVSKVEAGFDSARVVRGGMLDFNTLRTLYGTRSATASLKQRILDGMRSIPGVEAAAIAGFDPLKPNLATMHIEGSDVNVPSPRAWLPVSADYFETMGMSIIEGRRFDPAAGSLEEVIVDENFGRRYLGGRSPVGTRVILGAYSPTAPWGRIVGVVNRANLLGREERDGAPVVYTYEPDNRGSWTIAILVRSARTDPQLGRDVASKLREIDPRLPATEFLTFEQSFQELLVGRKGITTLLASFGILALLVAIVGLYAVLSLDVAQRRREIGIRVALGASRARVMRMVLRQGLAKIMTGLPLGIGGAIAISLSLRARLFDVEPFEPSIYGGVAGVLLLAGLVTSCLPAWSAAGNKAVREIG